MLNNVYEILDLTLSVKFFLVMVLNKQAYKQGRSPIYRPLIDLLIIWAHISQLTEFCCYIKVNLGCSNKYCKC